jgi:hypothetical protein
MLLSTAKRTEAKSYAPWKVGKKEAVLMRRILVVLTATLVMAVVMLAMAAPAFAWALPGTPGDDENIPGQPIAGANCDRNLDKQFSKGLSAGGGPKAGVPFAEDPSISEVPTNCDHFWQTRGYIGNN